MENKHFIREVEKGTKREGEFDIRFIEMLKWESDRRENHEIIEQFRAHKE